MLYRVLRRIAQFICFVLFRLEFVNRERLQNVNGKILCANHTSNWDPIFVAVMVPTPLRFMAKIELFKLPVVGPIFYRFGAFPVNRGNNDLNAIKTAISILRNSETLMIFPEGTRNRSGEANAKAGVVNIALHTDSMIVPIFISSPVRLFGKVKIIVGEDIYYPKEQYGKIGYDGCKEISRNIMHYIKELSVDEHQHYSR